MLQRTVDRAVRLAHCGGYRRRRAQGLAVKVMICGQVASTHHPNSSLVRCSVRIGAINPWVSLCNFELVLMGLIDTVPFNMTL